VGNVTTPLDPASPESPEEREARIAAERSDPAAAARLLLRAERQGALATISLHKAGWPFGSIAPYALSARGEPLLLLSALAQHTKNALADPRASLLVQESAGLAPGADPQAHGRVTVLGRIALVSAAGEEDAKARYLARHPQAARTAMGHDFRFYVLSIEEARFIGGFGKICWVPGPSMILDS
jgi:heme iron utilization protein